MQRVGSRAQVMHGNAKQTGGGLKKKDLKYNKQGKIVSKKMSAMAKKEKRLQKAGYTTKKGQFGAVRTMRGGVTEMALIKITGGDVNYKLWKPLHRHDKTDRKQDLIEQLRDTLPRITYKDTRQITSKHFIYTQKIFAAKVAYYSERELKHRKPKPISEIPYVIRISFGEDNPEHPFVNTGKFDRNHEQETHPYKNTYGNAVY